MRKVYCFLAKFYAKFFGKDIFSKFNKLLFNLSLKGLGVFNYQNSKLSGEDNFLKKHLSKLSSPIVFDIGANEGDYTLYCIHVNKQAKVYVFEPHPRTFEVLKNKVFSKAIAVNKAVSDSVGRTKLYDYKKKNGSQHASLYQDVIEKVHGEESIFYEIEVTTLDEFTKNNKINKINLLKIDTEGNELRILRGAKELIEKGLINIIQFYRN